MTARTMWPLWRQHRAQVESAAVVLGALAVLLAVTGVAMAHEYRSALTDCARAGTTCDGLTLFEGDGAIVALVNMTVAAPLLVGVFWGATAIGREYETGTNVLSWTQSITRRQWLRGKVMTLLGLAVVAGALLSGMVTWWSRTLSALHNDRFDPLQFDIQGLMPVAYSLFAAALGLFAGALWRRVIPAIATTVAGFVAVRLPVESWLRPHYLDPVTTNGDRPPGSWAIRSDFMHFATVVTGPVRVPDACTALETRPGMDKCMARYGYHVSSTYHPAGRYWTFQWIETGIFVGLAALLVAGAVLLVLRRDA